jgi:hypothetical protein
LFAVAGGAILPVAALFAGALVAAAEADTFVKAGVLVFLVFATAAEVCFFATFFAVAVTAALEVFGAAETALLVLALDLAPATFLEADFVFCFTMMSPLLMSKLEIRESCACNDIDANPASQQVATNISHLAFNGL